MPRYIEPSGGTYLQLQKPPEIQLPVSASFGQPGLGQLRPTAEELEGLRIAIERLEREMKLSREEARALAVRAFIKVKIQPPGARRRFHHGRHRAVGMGADDDFVGPVQSDEDILAGIVADAQKTENFHKLILSKIQMWEERSPGILSRDDDLRNTFIDNLSKTEQDFTNRGLAAVGIQFPYQLNRANPAHAIILAVRDDIKGTANLLQSKKWQAVLAKEIQEIQTPMGTKVAATVMNTAARFGQSVSNAVEKAADAAAKSIGVLPYVAGAVAVAIVGAAYLLKGK